MIAETICRPRGRRKEISPDRYLVPKVIQKAMTTPVTIEID